MPIFSIFANKVSAVVYKKYFTNPVACAAFIFGICVITALILALLSGGAPILAILLMALLTGSTHGINMMLISTIPAHFKKYGNVSTASGILNASTYLGSALSTYGFAALSENLGWGATLWMWVLIALCGGVLCLVCMVPFRKKLLTK